MQKACFIPRKPVLNYLKTLRGYFFGILTIFFLSIGALELFLSYKILEITQQSVDKILGQNYHLIKIDKFKKVFVEITPTKSIPRLPFPFYPLRAKVNNQIVKVYVFENDIEEDARLLGTSTFKKELFLYQDSKPSAYFISNAEETNEKMRNVTLTSVFVNQVRFLIDSIIEISIPSSGSTLREDEDLIDLMIIPVFIFTWLFVLFGLFRESKKEIEKRCHQIDEFKNEQLEWETCSEVTVESVSGRIFTSKAMKNIHKDYKVKKIFFIPVKYYLYLKLVGSPGIIVDGPEELIGKLVPINYKGKFKRMEGRAIIVDGLIYFVSKPTILN